ncbi:MAG: hypothetical protein RLY31_534 [Bacteroidota bacterium]
MLAYIGRLAAYLHAHFTDFEIILVNNTLLRGGYREALAGLEAHLRRQLFLLHLSAPVHRNQAIVAGLDRSNGDYTVIFETCFLDRPSLIGRLQDLCTDGTDIVYLQAQHRRLPFRYRIPYTLFYWILNRHSHLAVDDSAHDTRVISRRALNSLLRLREDIRFMKAVYSIIGFRMAAVSVPDPLPGSGTFGERFRTSLVAITSFTDFLRSLLLWIFLGAIGFLLLVIANAVKVKFTNVDFFGTYHPVMPGWTFLVVLSSIFFAITSLMLYIMSIYLSNIYQEIKHRPIYIIESIQRF